MAKTNFKTRVNEAVKKLVTDHHLLNIPYGSIYCPLKVEGKWRWTAICEPDGLLARSIDVAKGDPAKPDEHSEVIACVLVESEESTSNSLLNPWGKAHIPSIPNGVWIDTKSGNTRKRCILTVAHVLLITPEPKSTTVSTQKNFKMRRDILRRVGSAAPDVTLVIAGKNDGSDALATKIWNEAKTFLE